MNERDKRLERAAGFLEWAIRWFFHMYASRGSGSRWEYSKWRHYLKTWVLTDYYKEAERQAPFGGGDFPVRVVGGIDWLAKRWFGVALTPQEEDQLMAMLKRPRNKL